MGMTWNTPGELEPLSVTARSGEDGTSVAVVLDRRSTFVTVAAVSAMAMFLTVLFAVFALYLRLRARLRGLIAGIGGVFAVARGYWASSTRRRGANQRRHGRHRPDPYSAGDPSLSWIQSRKALRLRASASVVGTLGNSG
jgi:hypothetical protein